MPPKVRRRGRPSAALLLILPSILFMVALFLCPLLAGNAQAFSGP